MLYSNIFKQVKKIIPKISDTELIALRSGTISIDREIFKGKVTLPIKTDLPIKFDNKKVEEIIELAKNTIIYPNFYNNNNIIDYLGKNKFFSFIIDEKYGGTKLSVNEMSKILTKMTASNPPLGVTTMVPNSLGPGELISHYGTEGQKSKYLSGLANGEYVPCFGLTGPNNGSDALGEIDTGYIIERDGKLLIEIEINKRYITLAPVANLIGLAMNIEDPNHLLKNGKSGISLALLEDSHPGLVKNTYHNPLNTGFPNGTLKGKLLIELDQIIGGEDEIGNGWNMLMECLAAGRGICLPATANASSKTSTYGIYNYIQHRKQFNIPLIKMEAVSTKFLDMVYNTWLIQSSIGLTNQLLDNGEKPAVISAIMKQQTTERARIVLNNAMDIHAGSSICLGYSNFLEKFYRSAPIGITVEGSNTLTRNLIIFGQGLNKSHPYISDILTDILNNDIQSFTRNFNGIIGHSIEMYLKSILNSIGTNTLESQTIHFAHMSNLVALKGGSIKKEQQLSGDMADILSNIYLAYSVKWYEDNHNISNYLAEYCIQRLLDENVVIFNRIIDNYGVNGILMKHIKKYPNSFNYEDNNKILKEICNNDKIMKSIREDIYVKDTILEDLENLNNYDKESIEYKDLYNKIIQVGEYIIKT